MSRLSKREAKEHQRVCALLEQERLSQDDIFAVFERWQESAHHLNGLAGAFFTPAGLARDFSIEVAGRRIIDLCAGIGVLSYMAQLDPWRSEPACDLVCVEANPAYVEVGRKILPHATWICGSVFDLPADLGRFDCAISNPPFGSVERKGAKGPRYTGTAFEYHVIDIAADLADYGVFIVPQESAPFRYSGHPFYEERASDRHASFLRQTGVELGANCGIDCSAYRDDWHGVAPAVEIVTADFRAAAERRRPPEHPSAAAPVWRADLFAEAAE